jgi:gamma-glutamyltranspeptidase/glutathione hydrolase
MSTISVGWKATSTEGAIAAGAAEAVSAGMQILKADGNAADAAVATLLALMVTDHGECSIGGEVPLLIYDAKTGKVKALSGQGGAPLSQEAIDWYMQNGIPEEGNIKIAPVPSVVDLCITTLQHYGTKSFAEVVAPTINLLDDGDQSWHPNLAKTLRRMVESEQTATGSREAKLQAACDRFYGRNPERNDIADELEAFYIEKGGFLRRSDLAAHKTHIEDPVTIDYRGYTICKCGPWTQGPYLLQTLRLLEGFDFKSIKHLSADFVHAAIEAIKLAMADRDTYYGDPNFVEVPLDILLSDEYTQIRSPLIRMDKASLAVRPGDPYTMQPVKEEGLFRPGVGGTTTCVVADRWGNLVAATPSANVFGDDPEGGQAGVTFGNRLRSLNTTPGHPNCIAPGKRPRITLTPTLVLKDGKPILAISVAGGDLQDQVTLNLLLNFIEYGSMPDQAVTAPRFATSHHEDSFDPDANRQRTFGKAGSLIINDSLSQVVCDQLSQRGHRVETQTGPIGDPVMLYINPESGDLIAAGDPAAGRHAAGL